MDRQPPHDITDDINMGKWSKMGKWIQMFTNGKRKRILQSLWLYLTWSTNVQFKSAVSTCHFPGSALKSASCIQNSDVRGFGAVAALVLVEGAHGEILRLRVEVFPAGCFGDMKKRCLGINNESTYAGGETQVWSETEGSARQARVCKPQSLVSCRRYEEQQREYVCGSKLSTGFH